MLTPDEAVAQAKSLLAVRVGEARKLDLIHTYWRGEQAPPIIPNGTPDEIRRLAEMSRVNFVKLPVDVTAQALYVEGFRQERTAENADSWLVWQANRMDAHQTGVHRAALAYACSYVVVLPGDPMPVMRGASPRALTAVYGLDQTWPRYALEVTGSGKDVEFRLYDDEAVYVLSHDEQARQWDPSADWVPKYVETMGHGIGVCPVVRFRNTVDLDGDLVGEIEGLISLQDQIDLTTFELLVAQHFQSFRQRYVTGWLAEDEAATAKAAASRLWNFEDPDVKVGEFGQVDLSGYLDSRTSTVESLATLSQTPPHHLLGKLVNLSAEALAAAEVGQRRKVAEREITFGESWEQALNLAGQLAGFEPDPSAQVRWRDTEARALASTVDALGKMVQMLGLPPEVVWERIPGFTQQDIERAKALAASGDSIGQLAALLDRQATPTPVA